MGGVCGEEEEENVMVLLECFGIMKPKSEYIGKIFATPRFWLRVTKCVGIIGIVVATK